MSCWGFFACGCTAGVSLLVVALLWFLCLWLHHLSLSSGRPNATLGTFTGGGSGRFGLESCWGSADSEPRSTELLSDEVATSTEPLSKPVPCHAGVSLLVVASSSFSLGRQKATLKSFKGDGSGRFGLESCWGSAVSQPCSTELLSDEVATSTEPVS